LLTKDDFEKGVTLQRKYNGVRFIVFAENNIVKYSRTGTDYAGQDHIAKEILAMLAAQPDTANTNPYFDGELYLHGKPLNWISGQARREEDNELLEYHIFDVFFPREKAAGHDMESRHRQEFLEKFFANASAVPHPHVVRVENFAVRSLSEIDQLTKRFLGEKYEGAIARKDDAGYRYSYNNYHSANIVKIKPKFDAEFRVVGFTQGTKGKDVGAIVWICEVPNPIDPNDRTFAVVPKDISYEMRRVLFRCMNEFVSPGVTMFEHKVRGLSLTVEYAEVSAKTGKPLQAKAVTFRTYESGPAHDEWRDVFLRCTGTH
jgi:ATP-dependent DNA ligase